MPKPVIQAHQSQHQIYIDSLQPLGNQARAALYSIYSFVDAAQTLASNKDADVALQELKEFQKQTEQVFETERSVNPILRDFAETCKTYKISEECVDELFKSLRLQITNSTFTTREYRDYVRGAGEAVGVMCLYVLCYKRAVLAHKLTPAARALGAAICKVSLLLSHGETHKKHGRMHFPDVTRSTFNQARLAEVLVDIEADFRTARAGIHGLPAGTKTAVSVVYVYYYELLRQMRQHTASQISAGKVHVSSRKKLWLAMRTYASPMTALERGKLR